MNALYIIGTLFGIAGVLALATPFVRKGQIRASLELLQTQFEIEHEARLASDKKCSQELAELRGQLSVVTDRFAQTIADKVEVALVHSGVIPGEKP